MRHLFTFILALSIFITAGYASEKQKRASRPAEIKGTPSFTKLNLNNISTFVFDNGFTDYNEPQTLPGFFFPAESGLSPIFASGLLWGGKVNNEIRVGGSTYNSGLQPGKIISPGVAADPFAPENRIYRVRPDYATADLSREISDEGMSGTDIIAQYHKDWNEWPASDGAPFTDKNNNGTYEPGIDIPGVPGAAQTIFYIANDLNAANTTKLYGSQPIGIELHATLWTYQRPGNFGSVYFRKYQLINKSLNPVIDTYLSLWSDPDIGTPSDDFAGCDTLLNLGFGYNANAMDGTYGSNPPAVGFQLLEGPLVNGNAGDVGYSNGQIVTGMKNLPMTAFYYFASGDPSLYDPPLGSGASAFYNFFQGRVGSTGNYFRDPQGNSTTFALPGDPLQNTGWIDGNLTPAGDRRLGLSCGPFTLEVGDTKEVVYAELCSQIAEGTTVVDPYLHNLRILKFTASSLKDLIKNRIAVSIRATPLAAINTSVAMLADTISLDFNDVISEISWQMLSAPAGSTAAITPSGISASFTPVIAGNYEIGVTVTTAKGKKATGSTVIYATNIKPPKAAFSFSAPEMSLGDSVLVDASLSSDPQNLPLKNIIWSGTGSFSFPTAKTAYFHPYASGLNSCSLNLDNGTFSAETSLSIIVHPKLWNSTIQYSFGEEPPSGSSYFSFAYFQGDTLFLAIQNNAAPASAFAMSMYKVTDNSFVYLKTVNIPGIVKVVKLQGNRLYVLTQTVTSGLFGPGPLTIYTVGPDWALTPVLQKYMPAGKDIYSINVNGAMATMFDGSDIFLVDLSNAASPMIVKQKTISYASSIRFKNNYVVHTANDYSNNYTSFVVRSAATLDSLTAWTFSPYNTNFDIAENLLFTTYHDTLGIYDISSVGLPVKLATAYTPSPFPWIDFQYDRSTVNYLGNHLVAVNGGAGSVVYNVNTPAIPLHVASLYTGNNKYLTANNSMYFAVPSDMRGVRGFAESSINRIHLTKPDDVSNAGLISSTFRLEQNYPNPFNPVTRIRFAVPENGQTALRVFDVLGNEVAVLLNDNVHVGNYEIEFNGINLASGVYFYRLTAGSYSDTKKFVLLK